MNRSGTTIDSRPTTSDPRATRPAVAWSLATLVALLLSVAVGSGLAAALGVEEGALAGPAQGAIVLLVVGGLVLTPLALAWTFARRAGEGWGRRSAVLASVLAGAFLVVNVLGWLVVAASELVDRF